MRSPPTTTSVQIEPPENPFMDPNNDTELLQQSLLLSPLSNPSSSPPKTFLGKIFNTHLNEFDPESMVTSHFISPVFLAAYRLIAGVIGIYITIYTCFHYPMKIYLAAFTNLSWCGQWIYFIYTGSLTLWYVHKHYDPGFLYKIPPWLTFLNWLGFVFVTVHHWLIVPVFWAVLSEKLRSRNNPAEYFINIHVHLLDLIFAIMETFLSKAVIHKSHLTYQLIVAVLFLVWSFVSFFTILEKERFIYPFLDYRKYGWLVAVFVVGLAIAFVFAFFVARGLVEWRERIAARRRMERKVENGGSSNGNGNR